MGATVKLPLLAFVLVLAGCSRTYSTATQIEVLKGCAKTGAGPQECACALRGFEDAFSEQEYHSLDGIVLQDMPPEAVAKITGILGSCYKKQ